MHQNDDNDNDNDDRLHMVTEWVGQASDGRLVMHVRCINKIRDGFEPRLCLTFENADIPYRSGTHFWIEQLPWRRPPFDRQDP